MLPVKIALLLAALLKLSTAVPDSAGIVEMANGLAYGGIPYGSVSGMLAKYPGHGQVNDDDSRAGRRSSAADVARRPIIVTPNLRATRLVGVAPQPVQIYNLPAVVAPGVVGTISQIGY